MPNLHGALLDLGKKEAESLVERVPGTILVRDDIVFRPCIAPEEPSENKEALSSTPWHVRWAREEGKLTEDIPEEGWDSVIIAVLDTGVNPHEDFPQGALRWTLAYNALTGDSGKEGSVYDDNGHGTQVIGTIIGNHTGVTPEAEIIPVKVGDAEGNASLSDLAKSVDYLLGLLSDSLRGKHLIMNFSFATARVTAYMEDPSKEEFFQSLFKRIEQAGGLFFAAAGNERTNVDRYYIYPARMSSSIFLATGSITEESLLAETFSNYGIKTIDIGTPGQGITTTVKDGTSFKLVNGTSFSSPIAAAVAAALWARHENLENWQVRNVLLNTTSQPFWSMNSPFGEDWSMPFISRGSMLPVKLKDDTFIQKTKGTKPMAIDLVQPSDDPLGGGCSLGTDYSWAILVLPLLGLVFLHFGRGKTKT